MRGLTKNYHRESVAVRRSDVNYFRINILRGSLLSVSLVSNCDGCYNLSQLISCMGNFVVSAAAYVAPWSAAVQIAQFAELLCDVRGLLVKSVLGRLTFTFIPNLWSIINATILPNYFPAIYENWLRGEWEYLRPDILLNCCSEN